MPQDPGERAVWNVSHEKWRNRLIWTALLAPGIAAYPIWDWAVDRLGIEVVAGLVVIAQLGLAVSVEGLAVNLADRDVKLARRAGHIPFWEPIPAPQVDDDASLKMPWDTYNRHSLRSGVVIWTKPNKMLAWAAADATARPVLAEASDVQKYWDVCGRIFRADDLTRSLAQLMLEAHREQFGKVILGSARDQADFRSEPSESIVKTLSLICSLQERDGITPTKM